MDEENLTEAKRQNWKEELRSRRRESIQNAIRNFAISRQYLTTGRLSSSEKLIRYYEGIAMSVDPADGVDKYEEATAKYEEAAASFRWVTRYSTREGPTTPEENNAERDLEGETEVGCQRILQRQAVYNLAVLHHRRIIEIRDHDAEVWPSSSEGEHTVQGLFLESKRLYESVMTEIQKLCGWDAYCRNAMTGDTLKRVDFATYLAARVGCVMLVTDSLMHPESFEAGTLEQASEILEIKLLPFCERTGELLEEVIKLYADSRTEAERKRKQGSEHAEKTAATGTAYHLGALFTKRKRDPDDSVRYQVDRRPEENNSEPILRTMLHQVETARDKIARSSSTGR